MRSLLSLIVVLGLFGSVQAHAEDLVVDVSLCRTLVSHSPRNDVNYQPGKDYVNGKQVVPADVSTSASQDLNFLKTETIEIPLTVDLARKVGLDAQDIKMEKQLPPLYLRPDGRVFWQGRDLTAQAIDLCEGYKLPENLSGRDKPAPIKSPATPAAPVVNDVAKPAPPAQSGNHSLDGQAGDEILQ